MERVTFWSHETAAADDAQDDDEATSSVRRLIDVIVTSEHLQFQRNLGDVQFQLSSNGIHDEPAVQVCRIVCRVLSMFSDVPRLRFFRDDSINMTRYAGAVVRF